MAVAKVALHTNEGMGCMAKSHYDKIAVISGGANGIGQAFAQRLAHDGAHIVIADVASGSDTVKMVEQVGRHAVASKCDVSSRIRSRRLRTKSPNASAAATSSSIA